MNKPEIVCCGVPFGTDGEVQALKNLKDCGFTSVQIYVFWDRIEPEKCGEFDWSYYDRMVKLIQDAGLKWVPFLIFGPRRGLPKWWLDDSRHCGMKCLEHEVEGGVESIWNPHWSAEVTRLLEAFAQHYLPWNVIESVQPGISGDYGEAIFPAIGNWPGMYHTHYGYWCMDKHAVASFRNTMEDKYKIVDALNRAWRVNYNSFDEVVPFKRHKTPSRTATFDMMMWYKNSMTQYDEFWMKECQRVFKGLPVYMCTGGAEEAYLGADFAEQARASAKYGGGIRLTNEGNVFQENYADTVHCETACKFYGAYIGLEPVGGMIPRGVTARIFGSAAYGNRQIFHYYGNLFDGNENGGAERVKKYLDLIGERETKENVAVFLPLDMAWVDGTKVPENIKLALNYVRNQYETGVISETMIEDGILDNIKVLIMLGAQYTRKNVLVKIAEWIKNGGVLITDERCTDIEGDYVPEFDKALGFTENSIYCGGITEVIPDLQPWNRDFCANDVCHTKVSWSGLADDVTYLLKTVPREGEDGENARVRVPLLTCAFEHKYGKGRAVYYCGRLVLKPKPDSMYRETHAYEHILSDLLREFAGVKALGTKPDEIARARVNGKMMILKTDDISFEDDK